MLRLLPIWASCIIYAIIFSQTSTFFTKQAATLDRRIGARFKVPPAALQTFISVSIVVFIPVYDRLFVPLARRCMGRPAGITMLQRIGAGLALSLVAVALSALVEMKRLGVARDAGLVNTAKAQLPMSLWWMVPQYVLIGVADVFAMIGLQEFFYDQVPDAARSLGPRRRPAPLAASAAPAAGPARRTTGSARRRSYAQAASARHDAGAALRPPTSTQGKSLKAASSLCSRVNVRRENGEGSGLARR